MTRLFTTAERVLQCSDQLARIVKFDYVVFVQVGLLGLIPCSLLVPLSSLVTNSRVLTQVGILISVGNLAVHVRISGDLSKV